VRLFVSGDREPRKEESRLFAYSQATDHLEILPPVVKPQVLEQTGPLRDHHQQSAAAGMVLGVRLEMIGQIIDPGRQESNLQHFKVPTLGEAVPKFNPSSQGVDTVLALTTRRSRSTRKDRSAIMIGTSEKLVLEE
jgi:hypothetical protein